MDWRSLTQVKELGWFVTNLPALATDLLLFFDDGWTMASIPAGKVPPMTRMYDDVTAARQRRVPCWSALLPASVQCHPSPLPPRDAGARTSARANTANSMRENGNSAGSIRTRTPLGTSNSSSSSKMNPLMLRLDGSAGPASAVYASCAPPALCTRGRTDDQQAMVDTILTAKERISIAVMDFIPASMGLWSSGPPVYWPALTDAVLQAVSSAGVTARLLVSKWQWSDPRMRPYLQALQSTAAVCAAGPVHSACQGSVEIKYYAVPGWNSTVGPTREFPGHSRVNHNKYIVSEHTANIATSNMAWSYFATTVGTSLNVQDKSVASALGAIFDRDWNSIYATTHFD